MSDIEKELRSKVDGFVGALSALIRAHALGVVQEMLGRGGAAAATPAAPGEPVKRKRGRPRKHPLPVAPAAAVSSARAPAAAAPAKRPGRPSGPAKRAPGEKRSPQELTRLTEKAFEHIKANPGSAVEQISKALSTPTKDLTLPLRKLMLGNKISSKGRKRATRYYPRG